MSLKKIELNEKEELRVEMRHLKGRAFADVRVYACAHAEDAKWPTGKGFLVPTIRLNELRQALAEIGAETSGAAVS